MELFEAGEVFDDDYVWFYDRFHPADVSAAETAEIVALLGIEPGAEILDVPCGDGRIANRLAAAGFRVTGVDSSESFLVIASIAARTGDVDVEYLLGDMRVIPSDDQFDAVVCWFTSFGYFTDEGNQQVLAEFARLLKPGGTVLIETINREFAENRLAAAHPANVITRGEDTMSDYSSFDSETGRLVCDRTVIRDGSERHIEFAVRVPTVAELTDWLVDAGFRDPVFTSRQGEPLTAESFRLVVRAKK